MSKNLKISLGLIAAAIVALLAVAFPSGAADSHSDPAAPEEPLERSRVALRLMRRLRPAQPDDFDILVPEADRDFLLRIIGIVGVAVIPISSLALLVAGIVVMNMMLVRSRSLAKLPTLPAIRSWICVSKKTPVPSSWSRSSSATSSVNHSFRMNH